MINEIIIEDLKEIKLNKSINAIDRIQIDKYLKEINKGMINYQQIANFYIEKKFFYLFESEEFKEYIDDKEVISNLEELITDVDIDYNNIFQLLNLITYDKIPTSLKEDIYIELKSKNEYRQLLNRYFNIEEIDNNEQDIDITNVDKTTKKMGL